MPIQRTAQRDIQDSGGTDADPFQVRQMKTTLRHDSAERLFFYSRIHIWQPESIAASETVES